MVSPCRNGLLVLEDGLGRDLDTLEVEKGSRVDDKLAQRALDGQLLKPSAQLLLENKMQQRLQTKIFVNQTEDKTRKRCLIVLTNNITEPRS